MFQLMKEDDAYEILGFKSGINVACYRYNTYSVCACGTIKTTAFKVWQLKAIVINLIEAAKPFLRSAVSLSVIIIYYNYIFVKDFL